VEDKNMNNENRNDEAVSPVIATILMVAITVVLAGVLYVWASSLAGDSTGGGLDTYTWDDRDAQGSGNLVEVSMSSGDGLNWAVVKITISVDGGTPQACAQEDTTASCSYTPYQGAGNSQQWETSEGITIEGSCPTGATAGCDVDVTITKMGVGSEDDKVIGQIAGYADLAA
jgi:flagellin-like protein